MEETCRYFFALRPDEAGINYLKGAVRNLERQGWKKTARFVPPKNLHLTLQFLGEVPAEALETARRRGAEIAAGTPVFAYEIGKLALFPRVSRARIIAAMVDAGPELKDLAKILNDSSEEFGIEPETRPFKAHITVARLKPAKVRRNLTSPPEPSPQQAEELLLYRSILGGDHATYEVVDAFPFQTRAAS